MKFLALCLALPFLVAGCQQLESRGPTPQSPAALTSIPDVPNYSLGTPISYGRLTVVPVLAKENQQVKGDYATLAEAKKNGWVEIIERPGNETVNRLLVRNTGPKDVLLLGGELLLGGKQDRVVAYDTVVPAGKEIEVEVYCVEQGRWEGSSSKFDGGQTMVPDRVRKSATYENQEEVWNSVAEYRDSAGAANTPGTTIRGGLEQEEIAKKMDSGLATLLAELEGIDNVVGVVVAMDGEARTLELFGNSSLFKSAQEPLLKSFLAESAVASDSRSIIKTDSRILLKACATFVSDVLTSRRRLRTTANGSQGFDLAPTADGSMQGRELADRDYEGKPAEKAEGLIHGTYRR